MAKRVDKKKMILRYLNSKGRSSTSNIASAIRGDINRTKFYLEELLKEKKIMKETESLATYWSLK